MTVVMSQDEFQRFVKRYQKEVLEALFGKEKVIVQEEEHGKK